MKRILALLIVLVTVSCRIPALAEETVEIYIDNDRLECDTYPVNIDGSVLVPMRAIFEALGMEIYWNSGDRTVWAHRGDEFIAITVDSDVIGTGIRNSDGDDVWVDKIQLDVPARIINDYTYVPVRAVSETLGSRVSWDGENNRVLIDSRRSESGNVYYVSDSDFQKLYTVGKNGLDRHKISDNSVYDIEMYDGYVYYLSSNNNFLYRADAETGASLLIDKPVNKIAIEDGYLYYQERDGGSKRGVLYRLKLNTGKIERLTDNPVQYPQKYRDLIYFNLENDNKMYALSDNGTALYTIDTGDSGIKLYPFNCIFYGDYILLEDGAWYGFIIRMDLDGSNAAAITKNNSVIFRNLPVSDKLLYLNPNNGQDIYCVNIDGSDNHLVHEGDPSWIGIDVIARWDDMIYYRHPARKEIYRVKLDGSDDTYICYADNAKVIDGRLFTSSANGFDISDLDSNNAVRIYDKEIKDFSVIGNTVYLIDKSSSRLYMADFNGNKAAVTSDAVAEWVCD